MIGILSQRLQIEISKLKIQRLDLLCNHITKYVVKDVVHKYLCLAFARQENVSVEKIFGGKEALLTVLRILSNIANPNPNDAFARAVYVRCICGPSIELPSHIPTFESRLKVYPRIEALESMTKYFSSFESIPGPLMRSCLLTLENCQIERESMAVSSAIVTLLKTPVSDASRDVSYVIPCCMKRTDLSTISVAAACVPFSCDMRLVRTMMNGFSFNPSSSSSIAVSEIAIDAMIRQADREDRNEVKKTMWSSKQLWSEMFPRILLRAQIREHYDEDESDRYRRAYLRDASERACSALGLTETLSRLYRTVSTTSDWRVAESCMFVLWSVAYVVFAISNSYTPHTPHTPTQVRDFQEHFKVRRVDSIIEQNCSNRSNRGCKIHQNDCNVDGIFESMVGYKRKGFAL